MGDDDRMKVQDVQRLLGRALRLQMRSVVEVSIVAGRLQGPSLQGIASKLERFALSEVEDLRLLVEKLAAVGGEPASTVPDISATGTDVEAVRALIEHEEECLSALHDVIPETGQEPRSEAMEHLLEHVIMRKQNQVDYLRRAIGEPEEG